MKLRRRSLLSLACFFIFWLNWYSGVASSSLYFFDFFTTSDFTLFIAIILEANPPKVVVAALASTPSF